MTDNRNEHRRPNPATIVGSGLAVVAAGSLLAFSSLAEQAGLQGLATGGINPTIPARGDTTRAIRLPAPATDGDADRPVDPIDEIVREAIARANANQAAPRTTAPAGPRDVARPEETPPVRKPRPEKRKGEDGGSRGVVVAARTTGTGGTPPVATAQPPDDGPPYGNAYGHDKHDKKAKKIKKAKPGKAVHKAGQKSAKPGPSAPVYAKSQGKDAGEGSEWKPKKLKPAPKADKSRGHGHSKHAHDKGNGKGKGKGHSKKH